jgi:nucleoside 2-deoxyribosyltransferase
MWYISRMGRCFVIQPFDKGGPHDKRYHDVLSPAVEEADLESYRVDLDRTVSVVMDSIEEGIRQSDACLADITTNNPNVWFELGYALALGKGVVLICSKERGEKYPFDIQNRHIIEYTPESPSDFAKLKAEITEPLKAIVANQAELQNIASMSPVKDIQGLSPHEMVALTIIMGETVDSYHVSANHISNRMSKAGFNRVAVKLSLASLSQKELVESFQANDGVEAWLAYRMTEKGEQWMLDNERQFRLRTQTSEDRPKTTTPVTDEDLPF